MDFQPIEDYGVIGNMRSIALVGTHGSIGFFCIQPELDGENSKQLYLPDTNVLVTRFLSETGIAEITDFMPILGDDVPNQLIRLACVIQGEIKFKLECFPGFDYARCGHSVEHRGDSADGAPGVDSPRGQRGPSRDDLLHEDRRATILPLQ